MIYCAACNNVELKSERANGSKCRALTIKDSYELGSSCSSSEQLSRWCCWEAVSRGGATGV